MRTTSYHISENLYLVGQTLPASKKAKPAKPPPLNHVFIIDCSGSMYSDLPHIRQQVKQKLPKMMGKDDTLSIIWFSGRGQFGTLLEGEPLASLADLAEVNKAVDRWLRPVCLTGFKEPLEEAVRLVGRVKKSNPKGLFNLLFLSDGWDNQWNRGEIFKALTKAAEVVASTTIVEYGYYADRQMLASMATKAGGAHIFAEDFPRYDPQVEAFIRRQPSATRVEVSISGDPIEGLVFALGDEEIVSYEPDAGTVAVPERTQQVWYLSPTQVGTLAGNFDATEATSISALEASYAALSLLSLRMKPDLVYPILKALGDVRFIKEFGGCFGKQKYSAFMEATKRAAFDATLRLADGYDPDAVPADDAFTIIDLLDILSQDSKNTLLLDHPEFKYSRVSRARVDASEKLTAEEEAEVTELGQKIGSTKDAKKLKEYQERLAELLAKKQTALKFKADKTDAGYPITNLTWNESRPNVSIQTKLTGTVDISERLTDEAKKAGVPVEFPTFIFRNYTIIKDGLVNVEKLPVKITKETLSKLKACPSEAMPVRDKDGTVIFDLTVLPVINRNMVKEVSAEDLFRKEWALQQSKAEQKVYNSVRKELAPKTSKGFKEQYGAEVADWLKEQGFTDYSGFSPKQVQAEASDFYMAKELKVKLKGFASLPSLKDVRTKVASGKALTSGAALMGPHVKTVDAFLASDGYKKAKDQTKVLEAWMESQAEGVREDTRKLILELAKIKFAITVGQVWFKEFASLEENSLDLDLGAGKPVSCTVEQKEVEVKI